MADEALEIVARIGTVLQHDDIVAALHDEAVIAETKALLDELADPDFACTFVAPEYVGPGGRFSYRGPDGFVDGWREWLEAYDSYRVELEELTEGEDGRLLTLGRQTGTTRTGAVEISEPAAAVWRVRDGRLLEVEFHLDPDSARRAAGLTA